MNQDYYIKHVFYRFKDDGNDIEIKSNGREFTASLSSVKNEDYVGDIMEPGAFDKFLSKTKSLVMLRDHDPSKIIGEWTNMKMEGDLLVGEGRIVKGIQAGKETAILIKENLLKGVSIGFSLHDASYVWRSEEGAPEMSMRFDVVSPREASIVMNPANEMAGIMDVKSYNEERYKALHASPLIKDDGEVDRAAVKKHLKKAGLTRTQVNSLTKGMPSAISSEPQTDMTSSESLFKQWLAERAATTDNQ